jgi:sulfite dehydrogenase (quinone) subunit SoeC
MHPALSVIFFTTATGAGYGLLALLGVSVAFGAIGPDRWFGFVSLGLALALITAGLLSSTAHLGHPERAWRAFSQWRSSWLSREGVMSVLTYLPAAIFGIGWVILGHSGIVVSAAGLLAAVGALLTVFTTGMIYASLKPIAAWHSPFTAPGYIISSLMTGAVLFHLILRLFAEDARAAGIVAAVAIAVGWGWKVATWRHNDALSSETTLNSATGLKDGGVRSIEWPHTEENYVSKEMGYAVARKHAAKLRLFVQVFAFGVPLAATLAAVAVGGVAGILATLVAVLSQAPGILAERWLFFAEAKHAVTLYYGR